jgi:hypothetical protein
MAMLNYSQITKAIEDLLRNNLKGYKITRNEGRNEDPNQALGKAGWIGIYRGTHDYNSHTTGSTPWLVSVMPLIEVQVADVSSGASAEDKLERAIKEITDILTANKSLNNTIAHTKGYKIDYQYQKLEQIYFHSAVITIKGECRA